MRLRHRNAFEHGLQGLCADHPARARPRAVSPAYQRCASARPRAGRTACPGRAGSEPAVCPLPEGCLAAVTAEPGQPRHPAAPSAGGSTASPHPSKAASPRPRPRLGVRYRGWTLSRDLSLRQSGRTGRLRTTGRRHLFKTVTRGGISRPETPARPQGVQALHPAPSPVLAGIGDGAPIPEARHIRCARRKAVKRRLPGLVDIDPHHANILTRTDKHRLRRPVNRPRLHRQRRFRQRGMRRLILAPGVRPGGAGQLLQTGAAKVGRGAERATTDLVRPSVSATWCRRSQAMHPGRFSGLGETGIGPAIETSKAAAFLPWSGKCSIPSSA